MSSSPFQRASEPRPYTEDPRWREARDRLVGVKGLDAAANEDAMGSVKDLLQPYRSYANIV